MGNSNRVISINELPVYEDTYVIGVPIHEQNLSEISNISENGILYTGGYKINNNFSALNCVHLRKILENENKYLEISRDYYYKDYNKENKISILELQYIKLQNYLIQETQILNDLNEEKFIIGRILYNLLLDNVIKQQKQIELFELFEKIKILNDKITLIKKEIEFLSKYIIFEKQNNNENKIINLNYFLYFLWNHEKTQKIINNPNFLLFCIGFFVFFVLIIVIICNVTIYYFNK